MCVHSSPDLKAPAECFRNAESTCSLKTQLIPNCFCKRDVRGGGGTKKKNVRIKLTHTHTGVYWASLLMDGNFKTAHSTKICKPLRPVTKPLWVLAAEWNENSPLRLMAFHRDSQLECQCFLSVLLRLFVVNVCLDSPPPTPPQKNLPPTIKEKREQTSNICFLLHMVLRLGAAYFPFVPPSCGMGGRGGGGRHIERCVTLKFAPSRIEIFFKGDSGELCPNLHGTYC